MLMKNLIVVLLCSFFVQPIFAQHKSNPVIDPSGAIIRGDTSQKVIALVFTGHEFSDGGFSIRKTLKVKRVKASLFRGSFRETPALCRLGKTRQHIGYDG
jgi:hypothetical protein